VLSEFCEAAVGFFTVKNNRQEDIKTKRITWIYTLFSKARFQFLMHEMDFCHGIDLKIDLYYCG